MLCRDSCCLRHEQKPALQQILNAAADNNNVLFVSVSDHYELCLGKGEKQKLCNKQFYGSVFGLLSDSYLDYGSGSRYLKNIKSYKRAVENWKIYRYTGISNGFKLMYRSFLSTIFFYFRSFHAKVMLNVM